MPCLFAYTLARRADYALIGCVRTTSLWEHRILELKVKNFVNEKIATQAVATENMPAKHLVSICTKFCQQKTFTVFSLSFCIDFVVL